MGLFGKRKKTFDEAFAPVADGTYKQPQEGFWNGGGKFTGRDGLSGLLAVIGDAFANQAGMQGGAVENLSGGRLSAIAMAKKQAVQAQEMEAARQRAVAAGVDPARADMMARGDPNPSEWMPKQEALPERARMAQWYQNASPQERQAYDATNPIVTNGYGSAVVPRTSLPGTLDPNLWEPLDEGGPTQPASGGFRRPPRYRR